MNIILSRVRKLNSLLRFYSYKPIKRPEIKDEHNRVLPKAHETVTSSLSSQLRAKILTMGPLTVAEYMKEVLTNPSAGYYMSRNVFGISGDFITSPEINQIFGELVAVWCMTEWQKIGAPSPFQIIELGPGLGTLARDVLRVLSHFNLGGQFSLHLVEISPFLSKVQAQRLCFQHSPIDQNTSNEPYYYSGDTLCGTKVFWYQKLDHVPKNFSILLAHEFFDALPIHKLQKDGEIWKEVLVDIDENDDKKFRFVLSKSQTPISKIFREFEGDYRDCLEYSVESESILMTLTERFEADGGFGLIMDYGHFGEKSDTFRAFRKHQLHDPLVEPGSADLTADVDFMRMKSIAEKNGKLITFGPIEQGTFLKRMQGDARLKVLLENALPENIERIKSGYEMLTHQDQMGKRFKFFSLFPSVLRNHLMRFPVNGFSEN